MKTAAAAAAARTWKSLTSKIHPPLPMSPRESQRLLSLLNASFKEQLDREHTIASSSNEHHATNHLQTILTNPLFDAKPRKRANSGSKSVKSGHLLGQLQNQMKRPMDAFKERISQGVADLHSAKFFLDLQYKDCLASPAATPREAMQTSGAASTILQWLWASGMEDTGEFLKDKGFVSRFVTFLVADGQQSRVLNWLYQCHGPDKNPYSSLKIRYGDGLDSAINLFVRTVAGFRNARLTKSSMHYIATQAAWAITKSICRLPQAALPKAMIIRPFLETMRTFNKDPLLNAVLCVYAQESTDPRPALTFFQTTSCEVLPKMGAQTRYHIVLLGVRAAELFLQDGRQSEALWIMGYLRTNFAKELGLPLDSVRKSLILNEQATLSREEETSLHLLDTLAVQ
ncbi:hypothetical protein BDR22DRAFT_569855 [Usnea florida]